MEAFSGGGAEELLRIGENTDRAGRNFMEG